MSVQEKLTKQWEARFPGVDLPRFTSLTSEEETDLDRIEDLYRKCEETAIDHQRSADRHLFLATFYWDALHKLKTNQTGEKSRPSCDGNAGLNYCPAPTSDDPPTAGRAPLPDPDLDRPVPICVHEQRSYRVRSTPPPANIELGTSYLETDLDVEVGPPLDIDIASETGPVRVLNQYTTVPIAPSGDPNNVEPSASPHLAQVGLSSDNFAELNGGQNRGQQCIEGKSGSISSSTSTAVTDVPHNNNSGEKLPRDCMNIHRQLSVDRAVANINSATEKNLGTNIQQIGANIGLGQGSEREKPPLSTFKPISHVPLVQDKEKDRPGEEDVKPVAAPRPSVKYPLVKGIAFSHSFESNQKGSDPEHYIPNRKVSLPNTDSVSEQVTQKVSRNHSKTNPPAVSLKPVPSISKKPKPPRPQKPSQSSVDSVIFGESGSFGAGGGHHLPSSIPVNPPSVPPPLIVRTSLTSDSKNIAPETAKRTSKTSLHNAVNLDTDIPATGEPLQPTFSKSEPSKSKVRKSGNMATREEPIYEEPIAVKKDIVEEASDSSSDDEPLYYNIQLMKKRTLGKGQSLDPGTLYASVDMQKKHLVQQADRLSRRFSVDVGQMPKSSHKAMAPIAEIKLKQPSSNPDDAVDGKSTSVSSSDSVFQEHGSPAWKKRQSMLHATESLDSTSDTGSEDLDAQMSLPWVGETEKLQMRKFLVTSVLESEKAYVSVLDILMQYMQTFRNVATTAQSVILEEDIACIFYKVADLHKIHFHFIKQLEPCVENWTEETSVAEHVKILTLEECNIASDYLKNYQKAVAAIHKCRNESEKFDELTRAVPCKGLVDQPPLEELLHKPVVRFQRNTLVLHDLIKFTPTGHPDYDMLQKTKKIAQDFLENFKNPVDKSNAENQRYLTKQGLVVESVGRRKKLRHVFLFNDVIICTKQKISGRQKVAYDIKWIVPLIHLAIDDKMCEQEEKQQDEQRQREVETMERKVSDIQNELKHEMKKAKQAAQGQRNWSFRGHRNNVEKCRKKLLEQEAQLMLASPHLALKLKNTKTEKQHTILMASDYERTNWKEAIIGLTTKAIIPCNFSQIDLHSLVNSQKQPHKLSVAGNWENDDLEMEEEPLFGSLEVTIHRLDGLKTPADTFCVIEVDSYGHFSMKAKTNVVKTSADPTWDEDFELDLEGAQQLRILSYKIVGQSNELLGRCALELGKAWLRGDFNQEKIPLNETMSLSLTLRYRSREQTIKRTPSAVQGGLFGVSIASVTKRESSRIPLIITTCVTEVERRGLDDVGIYRVSGLSAEIQRLKKAFEKSSRAATLMVKEMDINVVTGIMKLYFRELPEALFTDKLYPRLLEGMSLVDPDAKESCMMSIYKSLPQPHYATVRYILEHLVRVSEHELHNKMSLHNLSTIFGPTLLRPASKDAEPLSMEQLFTAGARDAMIQTSILYLYLTIFSNKKSGGAASTKL